MTRPRADRSHAATRLAESSGVKLDGPGPEIEELTDDRSPDSTDC